MASLYVEASRARETRTANKTSLAQRSLLINPAKASGLTGASTVEETSTLIEFSGRPEVPFPRHRASNYQAWGYFP